jgi:hypothetical protein
MSKFISTVAALFFAFSCQSVTQQPSDTNVSDVNVTVDEATVTVFEVVGDAADTAEAQTYCEFTDAVAEVSSASVSAKK